MLASLLLVLLTTLNLQAVESRDKIALIDTGITKFQRESKYSCDEDPVNFSKSDTYEDELNHGSRIFNILTTYIDPAKTCILSVKVFSSDINNSDIDRVMFKAFEFVDSPEFKFFNLSFSGVYQSVKDFSLIFNLTLRGEVVVAAGNDGIKLARRECNIYPACYRIERNFHVASSTDCKQSNTGLEVVDFYLKRRYTYLGSSMAVPHALGELIKKHYNNKEL